MLPHLASLAVLLSSLALLPAASAPADLDRCTRDFLAHPLELEAANCFVELASAGQIRQALARIKRLVDTGYARNPGLRLSQGRVLALVSDSKPQEREKVFRIAADEFADRADVRGELSARSNVWRLLVEEHHLGEARLEVRRAREALARIAPTDPLAGWLRARVDLLEGKQHLEEGRDLARARQLLERARPVLSAPGAPDREYFELDLLKALAGVEYELGALEESLPLYRELERLAIQRGDPEREVAALYGQSQVLLEWLAELENADTRAQIAELARRTIDRAHRAGNASAEARARLMLAKLTSGPEAVDLLSGCLTLPSLDAHSLCLAARAQALAKAEPAAARADLVAAREQWDPKATDPLLAPLIWAELAAASWQVEPMAKAVEESWRAIGAIEELRRSQGRGSEEQAEMFSTWTDPYHQLAGYLFTRGDVAQAFQVLGHLRARALLDAVGPASSRPSPTSFASLDEVRRHLAPDQALLSFQVAPNSNWAGSFGGGSWLLTVTRDGQPRLDRLPERSTLRTEIAGWEEALKERAPREAKIAARLHGELLARAVAALPRQVRKLIVVPDDHLHRLPWAALRPGPAAPPLIDRFEISVVPSATWWLEVRRAAPRPRPAAALILAAPSAPASLRLPALPDAEDEGQAVRRAVGGDSRLLTGAAAAESALSPAALPRYTIVHLAAHARIDERHPASSGIFLAAGRGQDGRLTTAEISALSWDGMLAYLSACESQRGRVLRGEGTMSLARAFFAGRARTVVASLWRVRDDEAFDLAKRFYRHLGEGETAAAALKAAQREAADDGFPTTAWAGLTVLGDGELALTLAPRGRANPWRAPWLVALIALVAAAGLLAGLTAWQRARR